MNKPLISVIMSVYNSEDYLVEAIESILNQTHKNLEFIIVNDGSKDNSIKIIKNYMKKDNRIILIDRENKGLPYSLNEGISVAKGDYIARMDSDDISIANRFEKQLKYLIDNNLDVCGTYHEVFGEKIKKRIVKNPIAHKDIVFRTIFMSSMTHPSVMLKRHIFDNIKYNVNYKVAQDYQLWSEIILNNFKIGNIPEVLLFYREHEKQAGVEKQLLQSQIASEISYNFAKKLGDNEYEVALQSRELKNGISYREFNTFLKKVILVSNNYQVSNYLRLEVIKIFFNNLKTKNLIYYYIYLKNTKQFNKNIKDEVKLFVKSILPLNNKSIIYKLLKKF